MFELQLEWKLLKRKKKKSFSPCPNYTQRDKIPATASVSVHTVHTISDTTVSHHTSIKNHSHLEQRVGGVSL